MLVAVDAGYGFTKAKSEYGEVCFPSVVGKGRKLNLRSTWDRVKQVSITVEGKDYFVGELAMRESYDDSLVFDKKKYSHENTLVLILTAVMLTTPGYAETEVELVTGLPVSHLSQKQAFINRLKGHTFEVEWEGSVKLVTFSEVLVFPQAAGALFYELLDEYGRVKKEEYLTQKIGCIDIGFRTTDYVVLDSMKYIDKLSGSLDIGMNHAAQMIAKDIPVHLVGESEELREAQKQIARKIFNSVSVVWAEPLFAVFVAGGGASAYPQGIVIPSPQMANVRGFYQTGVIRLGKHQHKGNGRTA